MRVLAKSLFIGLLASCVLLLQGCEEDTIEPVLFGNLFGEVLEQDDNISISQVTISTNPPTSSVSTDADGRFVIESIPEGTYSLRAEKNGYLTQVASVAVFGDRDANVIVRLERDTLNNAAPSAPLLVSPADDSTGLGVDVQFTWSATDVDADDVLSYEVILFNSDRTQRQSLINGLTDTTYTVTDLDYNSTYFWQVIVDDGRNIPVLGPVWKFTTAPFPNHRFLFARARDGVYDIYSADGLGDEIQLTDNSSSNWRPRINPQRTKIAYISNQNIEPQLYVMDRDGSNQRQVTIVPISGANQLELDFAWSPDGTQLLYMSGSNLFTINLDGSGLELFARAPTDFSFAEVAWTAQGGFVAYRIVGPSPYRSAIGILNGQGTFVQTLFPDRPGATGGPDLSIPGDNILYTHDVAGFEDFEGRQLNARVFLRNVVGSSTIDLSIEKEPGTNDLDPRYSPDGAKVIFVNTNNDGISRKDIYVMDIDGTDRELLFENAEMPEWR